jgi:tRNA wybutosine-synthesizing protein 4
MLKNGYTFAEAYTMKKVYDEKLDEEEKRRIEKLEMFDEYEEWDLLQNHYCLVLGTKVEEESSEVLRI